MAKAKGIQTHKVFKLGKAPAKRDTRNLKFAAVLAALPALPPSYDFDTTHPGIPTPMFANDAKGDCVIAGRAHQTLRFEDIEQGSVVMISDKDVLAEYFKETGGPDTGLVVLDSLNLWRHRGWKVGKRTYTIQAYAEITPANHNEVKRAIFANVGVGLGVNLPLSARDQIQTGQPWTVTTGPASKPGSWGGHYVYVPGYTKIGPVCVTWGRKQQMNWAWLDKYCDEAYAIFDAKNTFKKSMVSQTKIKAFLATLPSSQEVGHNSRSSAARRMTIGCAEDDNPKGTPNQARCAFSNKVFFRILWRLAPGAWPFYGTIVAALIPVFQAVNAHTSAACAMRLSVGMYPWLVFVSTRSTVGRLQLCAA